MTEEPVRRVTLPAQISIGATSRSPRCLARHAQCFSLHQPTLLFHPALNNTRRYPLPSSDEREPQKDIVGAVRRELDVSCVQNWEPVRFHSMLRSKTVQRARDCKTPAR